MIEVNSGKILPSHACAWMRQNAAACNHREGAPLQLGDMDQTGNDGDG